MRTMIKPSKLVINGNEFELLNKVDQGIVVKGMDNTIGYFYTDEIKHSSAKYICRDGAVIEYYYDGRGPWWGVNFKWARHAIAQNIAFNNRQADAWNTVKQMVKAHGGVIGQVAA